MSTMSVERDADTIAIPSVLIAAPAETTSTSILASDVLLQELDQKLSNTDILSDAYSTLAVTKSEFDQATPDLVAGLKKFRLNPDDWLFSTLPSLSSICLSIYKHSDFDTLTPYKKKRVKRVFNANAHEHMLKIYKDDIFSKQNMFEMHRGAYTYADLLSRYDEKDIETAIRTVSFETPMSFAKSFMSKNVYTSNIFDVVGLHGLDAVSDLAKSDFSSKLRKRDLALCANPKALEQSQLTVHDYDDVKKFRISQFLHEVSSKFLTDNPEKYAIKGPNDTLLFILEKIKGVRELRKKLQNRLINDFYAQPTDFQDRCTNFDVYGAGLLRSQKMKLADQITAVLDKVQSSTTNCGPLVLRTVENLISSNASYYERVAHTLDRAYAYSKESSRWSSFLKFANMDIDIIINTNLGITYGQESFGTLHLGHYGLKGNTFSHKTGNINFMRRNATIKSKIESLHTYLRYDKDYYDTTKTDDNIQFKAFYYMLHKELSMQCEMLGVEISVLFNLCPLLETNTFGQLDHDLNVIDSGKSVIKVIKKNAFLLTQQLLSINENIDSVDDIDDITDAVEILKQSMRAALHRTDGHLFSTKLSFPKAIKCVFGDLIPDVAIEKLTSHIQKEYPVINKDDIAFVVGSTEIDFEIAATMNYTKSKNLATTGMMKYQANSCMRHKTNYDDNTGAGFFRPANPGNQPFTENSLVMQKTFGHVKYQDIQKHPTAMYANGDFLSISLQNKITKEGVARLVCGVHDLSSYRDLSNPNTSHLCDVIRSHAFDTTHADIDYAFVIAPIYTVSSVAGKITLQFINDFVNSIGADHPLYEKFNGKKIKVFQVLADSSINLHSASWSGLRGNKVSAMTTTKAYGINKMILGYVDCPTLIQFDDDGHLTFCHSGSNYMNGLTTPHHSILNTFMNKLLDLTKSSIRSDLYNVDAIIGDLNHLQFRFVKVTNDTFDRTRYKVLVFKSGAGGATASGGGYVYTDVPYLSVSASDKVSLPDTPPEAEDEVPVPQENVPLPQIAGRASRLGYTVIIDELEQYDDDDDEAEADDYDDIDLEPEEEDDYL